MSCILITELVVSWYWGREFVLDMAKSDNLVFFPLDGNVMLGRKMGVYLCLVGIHWKHLDCAWVPTCSWKGEAMFGMVHSKG
jgi:hypothetical protein